MKNKLRFSAWILGLGSAAFIVALSMADGHKEHSEKKEPVFAKKALGLVNEAYLKDVKPIFQAKCWDCHGDKTNYPWYYKIPGIRGIIDEDIAEAREDLNMTPDFPFAAHDNPAKQLAHLESVAQHGWMPPKLYRFGHPSSKLNEADKSAILNWVAASRKLLGISYFCPMHPEVTQAGPGKCPQCQMKLEVRTGGKAS